MAATASPLTAASYFWDPTTTAVPGSAGVGTNGLGNTALTLAAGNWNSSAFWTLAPTSVVAGDYVDWSGVPASSDVIFSEGTGTLNIAAGTVTIGAATDVHSLNIQAGRWTFAGSGGSTLTIGAGGLSLAAAGGGNISGTVGGDTAFQNTLALILNGSQTWTNNAANATNRINVAGTVSGNATTGNTNTLTWAGNVNGSGFRLNGIVSDGAGGGKLAITVQNLTTGGTNQDYQLNSLANTFTGAVSVKGGGLAFNFLADAGTASSLGAASGADSIINLGFGTSIGGITLGGTANGTVTASTSNRVINLAGTTGGGVIRNSATSSAVTLTLTGGITNAGGGNKSVTLGGTNVGANTISGAISDAGDSSKTAVIKSDAGFWILAGANTYTGGTTVNAGTLSISAASQLGQNVVGNNVTIAGGNLLLNADTNVGASQAITVTAAGGGIGVSYTPSSFPTITDNSGATGGIFGINYVGTGGIGSVAGINALFTPTSNWFLGSFVGGAGTYTGTSLTAGNGGNYRLGGGGGALTIQNAILIGANKLVVGSTGGGSVTLPGGNTFTGATSLVNGTLNVPSFNKVVGGTASSSLGAPTTVADGTIALGSLTNAVTLNYIGAGETTDRGLNFVGTTGTVTLGNGGTGEIIYTATPLFNGPGAKVIALGGVTDSVGGSIGGITNSTAITTVSKNGLSNSRWILTGTNNYTGATTITGGVLQTAAVSSLSTSYVALAGSDTTHFAIWQTQGSITRTLSGTNNAANLNWGANGGFAAKGGDLTVNLVGTTNPLSWGTGNFMGTGVTPMVFGSTTADHQVNFQNSFTLGDNVSSGFNRVIYVEKGLGGDSALLSGVISLGGGTSANNGFVKDGAGTLILSGTNTYTGSTIVRAGTLVAGQNSPSAAAGAFGNAGSAIILGDATTTSANTSPSLLIGGAFSLDRGISIANQATTGAYTIGGSTDNNASFTGGITTSQSFRITQVATTGANALQITALITALQVTPKTITFDNAGSVVLSGSVLNGLGTMALVKTNTGTTTLSVDNFHTGGTTLLSGSLLAESAGALGAGALSVSGGQLTLGSNIAITTTGLTDFTWTGGMLKLDLGADPITSDQLALLGAFTGSGSLVFDFNNTGVFAQPYTVVTFASTTFTDVSNFTAINIAGNVGGEFQLTGNSLIFTPIPEPTVAALCLAGLGILLLRSRREKRAVSRDA
ncbi:MAG: beta strand repeat-containing protein [Bradyrhizobium sp.]